MPPRDLNPTRQLLPRPLQGHIGVCAPGEQLLHPTNLISKLPQASAGRRDQHVQPAIIPDLIGLLLWLGRTDAREGTSSLCVKVPTEMGYMLQFGQDPWDETHL